MRERVFRILGFAFHVRFVKRVNSLVEAQFERTEALMSKSHIVLSDSGGIQEEAPGLGKPVLVMCDTTERPEALASGTVHLVGTDYDKIVGEVSTLLEDTEAYNRMSKAVNPYGDGKACRRIVEILK